MTTSVRLVSQPRLGVVDPPASRRVLHGGVALDVVVPDLIKREGVPILPDWGPHHPAMPENVGHAGKDEDWQHLCRDHLGRDSRADGSAAFFGPGIVFTCFWKGE